jgi:PAS domain S-box-containing protein
MDSSSGSGDSTHPQPALPVRADSTTSGVTVRFRPSVAGSTPTTSRRPTYNSWSGPRDFPSPNIYDLTLKMNADIGMDSFWENLIEIFVLNFYASRVTLSMPYDQTDIHNTPWGLKATYNGSIDRQETRIKLERRQSTAAPRSLQSDSDSNQSSDSDDVTPRGELPPPPGKHKPPARPVTASIEEQLDSMLNVDHRGKTHSNLQSLDSEDEPLIESYGVKRVLDRGSIVILSREYRDPQQIQRHEDEILATHEKELEDNQTTETIKPESVKSAVLAAWEQTFFKPPETGNTTRRYEEYEQPFASPWSQSPAPSPAILKESTYGPFFQSVESAFSPEDDSDYTSTDAVYAIGMEDYRSIIHIPLVHPQTSKSITSESESSGSGGPRIVPVAIISFLSTVAPYPQHLITSLAAFAPLVATSLSLAIRHSNVLHQLAHGTNISVRHPLPHKPAESQEMKRTHHADLPSPGTQSSGSAENTNSDTSTPTWELHGRLFSPAVALAETPSPFRSTLSTETDYFSHRSYTTSQTAAFPSSTHGDFKDFRYSEDDVPPQSSSSHGTVSTEQEPMGKAPSPSKFRRKIRKVPRTIHSLGATSQFSGPPRSSSKKRTPTHRSESFAESSDPYQMHTPSSRLLKVVVDSIPVHVFTAEPGTGTITWANGRTLAYRGVTAEAYIEDPHASLHPDDSSEYLRRWKRMLKHETDGISQSVRIKRFDAQYRWFAARVVPLRDARGGVVHWFGTSMDIHDAREAEINSARQEEIKASEIKYRSLAEASPQIVFAATPALGISYANSQWMSYSGVTYDETSKLGFLSFVHPEDRERCTLPARGNAPQYSLEIRLQSADKSYRWHLVKCIRIEERGPGKDEVWLGTWYDLKWERLSDFSTDIHDHKMLEISLKKSHEAAKAAEAEHRKRAEDALETRRQQEFFIVSHIIIDLTRRTWSLMNSEIL